MSEKSKKTCNNLNYVEKLHILVSRQLLAISLLASLFWVLEDITSSSVGIKFVQSLQGLKMIRQL